MLQEDEIEVFVRCETKMSKYEIEHVTNKVKGKKRNAKHLYISITCINEATALKLTIRTSRPKS